ncbi:hypothetical protein GW17_00043285 [Ensete ventricosum]|nr:hypothetical protein GW17_00043285 [Ensete ventricosum]
MVYQLHLGVNSGATRFAVENQAVNEATFRCPDEMGWKPQVVDTVRNIFTSFGPLGVTLIKRITVCILVINLS